MMKNKKPWINVYWIIDNPVIEQIVVAITVAPNGVVPGKSPYNEDMFSAQEISPSISIVWATDNKGDYC